jgi:hypothetical protein
MSLQLPIWGHEVRYMEALYDSNGRVYAWLNENGKIYGLAGHNLAFIDNGKVYSWAGAHIGWWENGHIRDTAGAVAVFTADATGLGVVRPVRSVRPVRPVKQVSPVKPVKAVSYVKPVRQLAWSRKMPF